MGTAQTKLAEAAAEYQAVLGIESNALYSDCLGKMEEVQSVERARYAKVDKDSARLRDKVDRLLGLIRCQIDHHGSAIKKCELDVKKGKRKSFDAKKLCPNKADVSRKWGPPSWTPGPAACMDL